MIYNIFWSEKKTGNYGDYIVADLVDPEGGKIEGVSINRKSKKGDLFPGFDEILTGKDIEGELWTSDAGKHYLFAPKKKLEKPNFMKRDISKDVEKAQERTSASVEKAQNNTSHSVRVSSTQRDAVLLAVAQGNPSIENVVSLRKELWRHWDDPITDATYPD